MKHIFFVPDSIIHKDTTKIFVRFGVIPIVALFWSMTLHASNPFRLTFNPTEKQISCGPQPPVTLKGITGCFERSQTAGKREGRGVGHERRILYQVGMWKLCR